MHTDEYEISLSRELGVCRKKIQNIKKSLADMEAKYNIETGCFVEEFKSGKMKDNKDFIAWIKHYEALKKWEAREMQYEELYRLMKI